MKSSISLNRLALNENQPRIIEIYDRAKKLLLCQISEDKSIKYNEGATIFATEAKEITTVAENFDLFYSNIKN